MMNPDTPDSLLLSTMMNSDTPDSLLLPTMMNLDTPDLLLLPTIMNLVAPDLLFQPAMSIESFQSPHCSLHEGNLFKEIYHICTHHQKKNIYE